MLELAAEEAEDSDAEATDNAELYRDDADSNMPVLLALTVAKLADESAFSRCTDALETTSLYCD